ncbi:MAG: dephospho-CoA kinase [Hespellia sp.]|nr:dephospho-CoA kinase [Hespellia sp.]
MKIIGVTGGVGSGKSQVLDYLEKECGAVVYKADEVAKKLQQPGQFVFREMLQHYGIEILTKDGELDRAKIAEIVFRDEAELFYLNQLIHPQVKEYLMQAIETQGDTGTELFVIEAALLLEDHYEEICDELWYIYTRENVRRQRLKDSRGYSDEKISEIMKNQKSEEEFRRKCGKVIDNSGAFSNTVSQLKHALESEDMQYEIT